MQSQAYATGRSRWDTGGPVYGTSEGDYPNRIDVNDGTAVESSLNGLPSGTYSIVVTTYDVAGRESEFSPVVIKTI